MSNIELRVYAGTPLSPLTTTRLFQRDPAHNGVFPHAVKALQKCDQNPHIYKQNMQGYRTIKYIPHVAEKASVAGSNLV